MGTAELLQAVWWGERAERGHTHGELDRCPWTECQQCPRVTCSAKVSGCSSVMETAVLKYPEDTLFLKSQIEEPRVNSFSFHVLKVA